MTDPDVHVGDKVRITYTYEGEVQAVRGDTFYLPQSSHSASRDGLMPDMQAVTVEVVERAVPKVGDVVKGTELDRLPLRSVVLGLVDAFQKFNGGWRAIGVPAPQRLWDDLDYRVLYVPEDGAS